MRTTKPPAAAPSLPGYSPEQTVELWVAEFGSQSELAEVLANKTGNGVETERTAIRRLLAGKPGGGAVAQRIVKKLGLPRQIAGWLKWMGQYHTRFADMPTHLCHDYLSLWDRPHVTETRRSRVWLELGRSQLALRRRAFDLARESLDSLERDLTGARDGAACLEHALQAAYMAARTEDYDQEVLMLDSAGQQLHQQNVGEEDRAHYHARLVDQKAYRNNREADRHEDALTESLEAYCSIPADSEYPFVAFRREHGRAYCLWQLGELDAALVAAANAAEHAADGGFVRLRSMSLRLQGDMTVDPVEKERLLNRAEKVRRNLEDLELNRRAVSDQQRSGS